MTTEDRRARRTAQVKVAALAAGFDLVGITSPQRIFAAERRLLSWLKKGMHADMKWMEREPLRRARPRRVMRGARSVMCLAVNYYQPDIAAVGGAGESSQPTGRVARYARGRDYHRLLEKRLKKFAAAVTKIALGERVGASRLKYYVDYGPFLERSFAEAAGIGFIGKNGNLITREFGSWVFLCQVLTDIPLDFDEPARRMCGSCTKCIDACPTGAIVAPGVVDARKCIAYLTIENRGEIPAELRAQVGDRIFGCDICQEVCPHNVRQEVTKHAEFLGGAVGERLRLGDIVKMARQEDFVQRFAGTPVIRAKLAGMKRNAEVVYENWQRAQAGKKK
ncbi:MAG: tRNA epoxyqueuosine(34) reductase QueG [Candidatus Kerfeldbacteria bacterium RIFCSPHIGHO2_12_FULL_48_17]|uniref:tRNA epoxyqueuosine(34) reductase QueG n=1 Tax=Candidatus Kerfeldbacteria bacterium RIFCSPHIGHO2_12_FULL_48_17 TaxID=1798542 RepID=A0A1G2B3Y4_9BACT|nr:MAG: tRNA epoxyqueuosine(34) reductase QueG [Candidatus Kerfeldbacteria bacterium RIFCSPHIGHO2_12_FULL_48_17]